MQLVARDVLLLCRATRRFRLAGWRASGPSAPPAYIIGNSVCMLPAWLVRLWPPATVVVRPGKPMAAMAVRRMAVAAGCARR